MNGVRQGWLVAIREMRERSRSRAFLLSFVLMVVVVAGMIVLPAVLQSSGGTKNVGLTGSIPKELSSAVQAQGTAVGTTARIHRYDSLAAGEQAVRQGDVDVLVVDGQRLEWRRRADEQLKAVVTGAIQLVAVRERAAAAGITPEALSAVLAPVPVTNVQLGSVAGRSPDDEAAASIMTVVLLFAISTFGALVLTGVVEEKSSRVVEVLLSRIPARTLLAGKIAGIGLLGLAQIGATALVALAAVSTVPSAGVPAVRGTVLAWLVVWFVLGYLLYATAFGVLGSLASRAEDAQSAAGPVTVLLIASYFVSFAAVGQPDSAAAQAVSLVPFTAPLAMPSRIAMGAAAWWEPVLAVALIVVAITGLTRFGGRVYVGAILRTGPTLTLRDAWRGTTTAGAVAAGLGAPSIGALQRLARSMSLRPHPSAASPSSSPSLPVPQWIGRGALLGAAVGFVLGHGLGIAIGLGVGAVCGLGAAELVRLWTGHRHRPAR